MEKLILTIIVFLISTVSSAAAVGMYGGHNINEWTPWKWGLGVGTLVTGVVGLFQLLM